MLHFSRRKLFLCLTLATTTTILPSGCGISAYQVVRWSSKPEQAERLEVVYRAHSADRLTYLPSDAVEQVSGTTEELATRDWFLPVLTLTSPHPDGLEGHALAVLRLEPVQDCPASVRSSFKERLKERRQDSDERRGRLRDQVGQAADTTGLEIARMDIPRSEVERLIAQLQESGYFGARPETCGSAQLEVRLNQRSRTRDWQYESSLDDLVQRLLDLQADQQALTASHLEPTAQ